MYPKEIPYRSEKYLDFIRSKPCLGCNTIPSSAAHQDFGWNAMSGKPPDIHALPLCHKCHIGIEHQKGDKFFWSQIIVSGGVLSDVEIEEWKLRKAIGYLNEYLAGMGRLK